jgi:GxxExxY protein
MHADERGSASIDLITEKVIGAAYKVANAFGCGFLEKVYENALAHELRKVGFHVEQQKRSMSTTMGFMLDTMFWTCSSNTNCRLN